MHHRPIHRSIRTALLLTAPLWSLSSEVRAQTGDEAAADGAAPKAATPAEASSPGGSASPVIDDPADAAADGAAPAPSAPEVVADVPPPAAEPPAAQAVASATAAPPGGRCTRWDLRGASAEPHESTTPVAAWDADLEEMIACMRAQPAATACLVAQGHFDVAEGDSEEIIDEFARDEEARRVRANGLAYVVIAHLYRLGAQPGQIATLPPRTTRTFRGVQVTLHESCPGTVTETDQGGTTVVTVTEPAFQAPAPAAPRLSAALYLGHDAEILYSDGWAYSALTALGLSLRPSLIYIDVAAGFGLSPDPVQRNSFQARLNIGYRELWDNVLRVGLAGGYRQASYSTFDDWLSRSWWAGGHVAACWSIDGNDPEDLDSLWNICAEHTLAVLGSRATRAREDGERLQLHPRQSHYRLGFNFGARIEFRL